MRSARWLFAALAFAALASAHACSPYALEAVAARQPCAKCDELLWLCNHAPRDWKTVDEVRSLLAELHIDES